MTIPGKLKLVAAPTIVPVIMAGGNGSRLWPLSRELYPKQFLPLLSKHSLLQETVLRAMQIEHAVAPLILGAEAHRFLLAEQLRGAGVEKATVILEPEGRGTAPAAAIAAHYVVDEYGPEAMIFLMSADQAILDVPRFLDSVRLAAKIAAAGRIVTFGVRPTRPETGFGYLMSGAAVGDTEAREVAAFTEKPDAERAQGFLDHGGYFWNAGLFLFRADRFLTELVGLEAKISQGARQALLQARRDGQFLHLDATAYRGCRSDSIDSAVMEKTRN
ncbi:MAG: mannose-1-phosphate guanylyltransferase/mannose-6-phosphate isomerase, partial [Hydrocarboniphaga effusa]|nr:mannose-1-phosphate guanylyltransferase/mannose-6-phosphate isomerase [Hydrocarboniphaga effusa]